jgi:predicted transglutaminase-like cysteine proteinase
VNWRRGLVMVATAISKIFGMKSGAILIAALVASIMNALPTVAEPERITLSLGSKSTPPPLGWIEFCANQPNECAGPATSPGDVVLSREAWMDLVRVNKRVNATIKPLTDLEHWGVVEHWSYPDDGYGDCEDYVLLKRQMLIQFGWPREALLITVVLDNTQQGHAVLMVTTEQGDFILDNQKNDILLWSETGYRFIKRQSRSNHNEWVTMNSPQPATATAASR